MRLAQRGELRIDNEELKMKENFSIILNSQLSIIHSPRRAGRTLQDLYLRFSPYRRTTLERAAIEGESPVDEMGRDGGGFLSTVGHVKSGLNPGGPPSKAKQMQRSIADSTVRER